MQLKLQIQVYLNGDKCAKEYFLLHPLLFVL